MEKFENYSKNYNYLYAKIKKKCYELLKKIGLNMYDYIKCNILLSKMIQKNSYRQKEMLSIKTI